MSVLLSDPVVTRHPTIFDYGNVVSMFDGERTFEWVIERKSYEVVKDGVIQVKLAGRGVLSILDRAVVCPEPGLDVPTPLGDQRHFGPMMTGEYGPDYDSLSAAVGVTYEADDVEVRAGYPANWLDDSAQWIWDADPTDVEDEKTLWLLRRFTFPTAGTYQLYAAGDNQYELYLNGQLVASGNDYKSFQSTEITVAEGQECWLAAKVTNTGPTTADEEEGIDYGAGFLMSIMSDEVTSILHTDTDWKVLDPAETEVGVAANVVIKILMEEARARGIALMLAEPDVAEPVGPELIRSFPVGSSILDVIGQLTETLVDVTVEQRQVTFVDSLGEDKTTGNHPVTLFPAREIMSAEYEGDSSGIKTSLLVKTDDKIAFQNSTPGIASWGRREGLLELGNQDALVADSVVAFAFQERSSPAESYALTIDTEHVRPYRDFGIGDWIRVPKSDGTLTKERVQAITVGVTAAGRTEYTPELSSILQDAQTRQQRWLKSISYGTLGGTISSSSQAAVAAPATDKAQAVGGGTSAATTVVDGDEIVFPNRAYLQIAGAQITITDDSEANMTRVSVASSGAIFDDDATGTADYTIPDLLTGSEDLPTTIDTVNDAINVLRAIIEELALAKLIERTGEGA